MDGDSGLILVPANVEVEQCKNATDTEFNAFLQATHIVEEVTWDATSSLSLTSLISSEPAASNVSTVEQIDGEGQPQSGEYVIVPSEQYVLLDDNKKPDEELTPQESQYLLYDDGTIKCFLVAEDDAESNAIKDARNGEKKAKNYVCSIPGCGRAYSSTCHLKVHERLHTNIRPYKCTIENCERQFNTDYGRKAHERTHTGEKPYVCSFEKCKKGFKTSGDLQKHKRTHTGERPFLCPIEGCQKSFTTSNICRIHIRTHTGEKPYVCRQDGCDKIFATSANYKNHMRIHTGEKPYACQSPGCDWKFTEYSSLYKHKLIHSQTKRYRCSLCNKSYRQVSTLTTHTRTVHGVSCVLMGRDVEESDTTQYTEILADHTDGSSIEVDEQLVCCALDNYFNV